MSTRITISYEHQDELYAIILKLKPLIDRCKIQPAKGKFKRAYLQMKTIHKAPEPSDK